MGETRAEVSLGAIRRNLARLRALAGVPVLAPVKADAYGHGLVPVARELERAGVAGLAVATGGEALTLREAGVAADLLLTTPPPPRRLPELVAAGVTFTLSTLEDAERLATEARAQGRRARVHLKLNTGLNRLGARPEDAGPLLARLDRGALELEGVFTHLVDSEDLVPAHAGRQLERFRAFLAEHEPAVRYRHAANTGALLNPSLDASFDLVRPGIGLYGYPPGPDLASVLELEPAMRLVAWVSLVKTVPAGEVASYNATWTAERDTTLATLRIGYADGLPRTLSNRGLAVLAGEVRPFVGRVCMDQILVDATGLDVRAGDDAVILGPGRVTAETVASLAGTNSYEILTGVGARVPREYAA